MSRRFSVCNGDADGLCSAVQWFMHEPGPVMLVTGLKRDRALLGRVTAERGDEVNVFDLALSPNRAALQRLLDAGVRVRYFDHDAMAGDLPKGALFETRMDMSSDACTSLLVDHRIGGACRGWALVGTYGDNLVAMGDRLAAEWGFGPADRERLHRLGANINYNAYGEDERDVRIAPAELYEVMSRYRDPRDMLSEERIVDEIDALRRDDLQRGLALAPYWERPQGSVHLLPDAPWSGRVVGTLANALADANPAGARAVLKPTRRGGYLASVRAPLQAPQGADALCRRFGGDGRAAAAGIDELPAGQLDRFIAAFADMRWGEPSAEA
jgi:hypothetical protein